ncbi:ankyrin repeat and SAM domain-containing protein 3 [Biomphalaria pfeifferi]|uniref:Ankyrin repeat and SAM domain-containing protein 3 n=1 Tax=Biomphalaria pfeifferi TaxID=112525 RepID=A0AAD8BMU1_BIOPF|nr:ankyrin repeat and SAM domain-containing protein 3 [Biomphalaria pfeifferi]
MSSELSFETSDEASENELLERSLSVWRGSCAIEWEDFTPIALDIHTACSIGHFEYVRSIILSGDGQKDRKNRGGWTPLMYACYIGHDNIVNLLIKEGCNMNMKNPRGHTPLMLAASCGNEGVAHLLVRNRAYLEVVDNNGWTALFHATYAGHQNFVAYLLEVGANKDAIEPITGMTPFMVAAAEGHEIIVQLFLQHGVNVNVRAQNGHVARSLAILNGHIKVVGLVDNHRMPISSLRSEPGLELNAGGEAGLNKYQRTRQLGLKSQGPSIRDGPEAIARMIDRTRLADTSEYIGSHVPKGYVSFPTVGGEEKEETELSHRDVTSPINPDDYKDSSSSREFDDFNDDSNAFTKTGAITIKSSSSSSGGLVAALGLSRDGSLDSDDSHSYELTTSSSEDILENKYGCHLPNPSPFPRDKRLNVKKGRSSRTLPVLDKGDIPSVRQDQINNTDDVLHGAGAIPSLQDNFQSGQSFEVTIQSHDNESADNRQVLPKDNMSQVEIVNRYLKNLIRNNSEKHTNQYLGFEENQWASDDQQLEKYADGLDQHQNLPELSSQPKISITKPTSTVSPKDINTETSDTAALNEVKQGSNFMNNITVSDSKPYVINAPGYNPNPPKDASHPRTHHHPQLNHHHPLHNRYNHSPVSSVQDNYCGIVGGNVRMSGGQFSVPPIGYNIPSYFYNDMASASSQSQLLPDLQLPTSVNPLSHLMGIFSDGTPSTAQGPENGKHPNLTDQNHSSIKPPGQEPPTLHPPCHDNALYCPPHATVTLPGHSTAQPVSGMLQWPDERGVNQDSPKDLTEMMSQLGLTKYMDKFEEQDVDLQVFLSLTDNDLKEIGIKLFGPRKKMTNAIARWHSNAPIASNSLEQAYADRLEGEMQEMAIQLNQAYENEENLKAQLLQEQQLRSVTESCLMEERSSWEQARQTLLETRNKMRFMGELLSRIRHHQKEWKKYLESCNKLGKNETELGNSKINGSTDCASEVHSGAATEVHSGSLCFQLVKRSESCLKEMQQTLASLVQSADRILKSTHSLSVGKDLT